MRNFSLLRFTFVLSLFIHLSVALPARAATQVFTPTIFSDSVDATPGDGLCADSTGQCSLRAAVMEINAASAASTSYIIDLSTGTYSLSLTSGVADANYGDLDLSNTTPTKITIVGDGSANTIIDAVKIDRVLDISSANSVELKALTAKNGLVVATSAEGGCINTAIIGTLKLTNVEVSSCEARGANEARGGGLYFSNGNASYAGNLVISNSKIKSNLALALSMQAEGGGIYMDGSSLSATSLVTSKGTLIENNRAVSDLEDASGGGVFVNSDVREMILLNTSLMQNSATSGSQDSYGGGLYSKAVDVELINTTVMRNTAQATTGNQSTGGGAYFETQSLSGVFSIDSSRFIKNTAKALSGIGMGGGAYLSVYTSNLTPMIDASTFESNSVLADLDGYGGGLSVDIHGTSKTVSVHIKDSILSKNKIGGPLTGSMAWIKGGGIYFGGVSDGSPTASAVVSGSSIALNELAGNAYDASGAGISAHSIKLDVIKSNITDNTIVLSTEPGTYGEGAGLYYGGTGSGGLAVDTSSISRNSMTVYTGSGGGLYVYTDDASFNNSTIGDNELLSADGAGRGAGIVLSVAYEGTGTFDSTTIAGNAFDPAYTIATEGGGLWSDVTGTAYVGIKNTLIADNSGAASGPACHGTVESFSYNLLDDATDCTLSFAISGSSLPDLTGVSPSLGTLDLHSGRTYLYDLTSASPAIDAGSCTSINGLPVTTDQRGYARGAACDIGAYEY